MHKSEIQRGQDMHSDTHSEEGGSQGRIAVFERDEQRRRECFRTEHMQERKKRLHKSKFFVCCCTKRNEVRQSCNSEWMLIEKCENR